MAKTDKQSKSRQPGAPPRARPNQTDHLKPHWFKPGQSGNPGGRPKETISWAHMLRLEGQKKIKSGKAKGKTMMAEVCRKMWTLAAAGNVKAAQLVMERMEGKPVTPIDLHPEMEDELFFIGGMETPKPNGQPHE